MKDILLKGSLVALFMLLRYYDVAIYDLLGIRGTDQWIGRSVFNFFYFTAILTFAKALLLYWYRRSKGMTSPRQVDNLVVGVNNIYRIFVALLAFLFVLTLFEIEVRDLFASLSIIAAAIAIVFKDYISNFVSGMLITFSNNISVGDHIKVGANKGRVLNISNSMFSLLTDDDDVVTLPNSVVYAAEVTNYTKRTIKKTSIDFEINLQAFETVGHLEHDLINTLADYRDSIQDASYQLKAVAIKKDAVEFKFQYILDSPDREKEQEIRRKVIRRVVQIIKHI